MNEKDKQKLAELKLLIKADCASESDKAEYAVLKEKLETADAIGPILLGLNKPVHILQLGSSVRSIVNMAIIAVVDAQIKSQISTAEIVKRSPWWKRLRKASKEI